MVLPEVKFSGTRRTQLLDDLRNRRRYRKLKEKAEYRKRWFISQTLRKKYKLSSIHPQTC